jgi:thiol-disulfide isomerase/thioredoxin
MIRLLVALSLLAAIATDGAHGKAAKPPERPGLTVATLGGATFDLAQQRGKWVVVNFWATWCSPCLKEMPDLSQLDEQREDVVVIGLAFEEIDAADLAKFMATRPVHYAIALVDVYAPPGDFPVPRGLPTTYLIDPDGHVAEHWLGPVTSAQIGTAIAKRRGAAAQPRG